MGGGRQPCSAFECRSAKLRELANYAASYADRVYIENVIGTAVSVESVDEARFSFCEDLSLLAQIRPLVEAGKIIPVTPPQEYCAHCLAKSSVAVQSRAKILAAAATAFGLTKAAADILEIFASRNAADNEIRRDDMYFLWRVQHAARRG